MNKVPRRVIAEPTTHYGSGRMATRNFRVQRLTGALNLAFLVFIVWFVIRLAGASQAEMVATLRNPLVALGMAGLVVNVPLHMRIGMREVIEDYVHAHGINRLCLALNNAFAIAIGAIGLVSIAKIVFWG